MSQQWGIVRELWDAFERAEFPAQAFADDAEWQTASDLPDTELVQGPAAIAAMLAEGWSHYVDTSCRAEEIVDCGDCVAVRWTG